MPVVFIFDATKDLVIEYKKMVRSSQKMNFFFYFSAILNVHETDYTNFASVYICAKLTGGI